MVVSLEEDQGAAGEDLHCIRDRSASRGAGRADKQAARLLDYKLLPEDLHLCADGSRYVQLNLLDRYEPELLDERFMGVHG